MHRYPVANQIPPPSAHDAAATAGWARWVREKWHAVQVTHLKTLSVPADIPGPVRLRVNVHLGSLAPADVLVEAMEDGAEPTDTSTEWPVRLSSTQSFGNGTYVFEGVVPPEGAEQRHALIVRVRPGATHETLSTLSDVVRSFELGSGPADRVGDARRSRDEPASVAG